MNGLNSSKPRIFSIESLCRIWIVEPVGYVVGATLPKPYLSIGNNVWESLTNRRFSDIKREIIGDVIQT